MIKAVFEGAQPFFPARRSLRVLREASRRCQGCDLYLHATQTVFGEGAASARIVFVGEQPGNDEDLQGRPFVGPAGRILNRAIEEAGLDRSEVYVTNVVKHFRFEERGKRRIHKKPTTSEVTACEPWLEAEVALVKPQIIVCLGATAAQALLGNQFRLTQQRGTPIAHPWAEHVVATVHPSSILRAPDADRRHAEYARLVADFKVVRSLLSA